MASTPFLRGSFTLFWTVAQWLGLGLTAVLLAGLIRWPEPTLHILWDMVILLLPAVFLINPLLWRSACPLATLNAATGGRAGARALGGRSLAFAWAVGIVLLAVMVPARRFLFNVNGPVLAATIVVVAVLALALGLVFSRRAGFCNAVCPVPPVEKLYGHMSLVRLGTPRCTDCNLCTPVGCIDLAGRKTTAQTRRLNWVCHRMRWRTSPRIPEIICGETGSAVRGACAARAIQSARCPPHWTETFRLSTDPLFIDEIRDVVGVLAQDTRPGIHPLKQTAHVIGGSQLVPFRAPAARSRRL